MVIDPDSWFQGAKGQSNAHGKWLQVAILALVVKCSLQHVAQNDVGGKNPIRRSEISFHLDQLLSAKLLELSRSELGAHRPFGLFQVLAVFCSQRFDVFGKSAPAMCVSVHGANLPEAIRFVNTIPR